MDLARCQAELDAMWLLNWRMAVHVAEGELTAAESSSIKVFGTERTLDVFRLLAGDHRRGGLSRPRARRVRCCGGASRHRNAKPRSTPSAGGQRGPARNRGHGRARHDPGRAVSAGSPSGPARLEELAGFPDHSAELAELVGQVSGAPVLSRDAVNVPMIRHWVEAMGDENPVYLSDEAAQAAGYDSLIAPPSMLQAWIMRGLSSRTRWRRPVRPGTRRATGPATA